MVTGPIPFVSDCFLTDQRGFSSDRSKTARMHLEATIDLSDVTARYVRINAPAFHARDVTIYRP